MIKATNNAEGIEISEEGERIRFVAEFSEGTIMERSVPTILVRSTWFTSESESLAKDLSYTENDETIDIQLHANEVYVFFGPPTEGRPDLVTVPKNELMDILRKFLQ